MAEKREQPGKNVEAFARERRSQMRGLLMLGGGLLMLVLWRADRGAIFHAGWWRLY